MAPAPAITKPWAPEVIRAWALEHLGEPVKRRGDEWNYLCPLPGHTESNASFSFNVEKGAYNCQACGKTGGMKDLAKILGVSLPGRAGLRVVPREVESVYSYTDENGVELFQGVRFKNPKDFRQRRPGEKTWSIKGVRRVLYRLPLVVKAIQEGRRVFICEGEKDVHTVEGMGEAATCNPGGVGMGWKTEYTDSLRGAAGVVILPDFDKPGWKHVKQVGNALQAAGIPVKVVNLYPDMELKENHGPDVSDWIKEPGNTTEKFMELVDAAEDYTSAMFPDLAPDAAPGGGIQAGADYAYPMGYVEALLKKHHVFTHEAGGLYVYQDGCYRLAGAENVLKRELQAMFGGVVRKHKIEEVLYHVGIKTHTPARKINAGMDGLINCKSGLYDVVNGELLPHTPEYLTTIQIPVEYNKAAQNNTLDAFLKDIIPAEDPECFKVLCEIAGYCLTLETKAEKIIMLTGNGANGKSTFLNLVKAFLGSENYSSVQLQELEEHRFKRAELFGKLANIFPDLQDRTLDTTGVLKTLATGESINAERKHQAPFEFTSFTKLIFSANKMPQSRDLSYAYFRRFLILPFPNRFEGTGRDPGMAEKITRPEVLSAFLNHAIGGLERLLSGNYEFTKTQSTTAALDDYQQRNDSALYFIRERCVVEKGAKITREDLYQTYRKFCEDHGMRPMSARRFNEQIRENFPAVTIVTPQFEDGHRKRSWDGLRIKDSGDE